MLFKNGNSLDCRRSNIEYVKIGIATTNAIKGKTRPGKYKGAVIHTGDKKYTSQIKHNKKYYYVGCYNTEIEAAKARDKKAIELYGEHASLNFKL